MEYNLFKNDKLKTSYGNINMINNSVEDGPLLLLLHGLGATYSVWSKMLPLINENIHICAIDLLGHGDSDRPNIKYDIIIQSNIVSEVINGIRDMYNTKSNFLMGNSYGAWVAAYNAMSNNLSGIILEDMAGFAGFFSDKSQTELKAYKNALLGSILLMNSNSESVINSIINSDIPLNIMDCTALSKINSKVEIIWGKEDKILDCKYAHMISECISGSHVDIIEGAGHAPHYSKAHEVSNIVNKFIF